MLEGSYIGSRDLPASCEQETKWNYNASRVSERLGKRPLEGGEESASRKAARSTDAQEEQEDLEGLHVLPCLQIDQPDNQHRGDGQHVLSVVQSDQQDQHQLLSDHSAVPTDQPYNQQSKGMPLLSAVQTDQPDKQHQEGGPLVLPVAKSDQPGQHQAAGMSGLCVTETDQPDNQQQAVGLSDSLAVQTDQSENQHRVEGLHVLSVIQTDQPPNQHEANGLQGWSAVLPNQPDDQDHLEDKSDSSSLINQLGREVTISCLLYCSRSDYGIIGSLNKSFHSLVQSGLLYKLRRQMGFIEHWVYFSCNLLEWEAFDPIRHRWMHLPRMNANECFMCSDKESLAVGTELLVFGKEIESHVIYRYSILTNKWSSGMRMNTPRCLFGSASLGEIAILAGGCDPRGNVLSSAELYNSESGTWVNIPSMNKARKMCSGVCMDGKFYVIGGIGAGNKDVLTSGEVYDLATKTWHEIPDMNPARNVGNEENGALAAAQAPPLVAVVNNELYAADYAEKEVQKYDKEKNVWITLGGLPERAASMNGWGLAFRACGDRLMVIGGPRAFGGGVIELNSWVPNDGPPQWDLLARKASGSFVYNCAVMGC